MTIEEFKKNIAPYMRKGWVVMDKNGLWFYHSLRPILNIKHSEWDSAGIESIMVGIIDAFNIEPVEDWTKSLIEVGK